jgi:hypothetical protein
MRSSSTPIIGWSVRGRCLRRVVRFEPLQCGQQFEDAHERDTQLVTDPGQRSVVLLASALDVHEDTHGRPRSVSKRLDTRNLLTISQTVANVPRETP